MSATSWLLYHLSANSLPRVGLLAVDHRGAHDGAFASVSRPLFDLFPSLTSRLPWARLADVPTPVESIESVLTSLGSAGVDAWVKRDDLTSPIYGGNKVRTLEPLFGEAQAFGASRVYATGAYGSNHAVASVLHARRVDLRAGAILFAQPFSETAVANLRVLMSQPADLVDAVHWSMLPLAMLRVHVRASRRHTRPYVMLPGGATPRGGLGYVSAALELARQVERAEMPRPRTIVLPVGSTCTSAGLLAGTHLAAHRGIGFVDAAGRPAPPDILSVRVTPWPVTSAWRIATLAGRILSFLAQLVGEESVMAPARSLRRRLRVDGSQLGHGYGYATEAGRSAITAFQQSSMALDTTYSAKAAAALIQAAQGPHALLSGPVLFWATKSSVPLPLGGDLDPDVPSRMVRWSQPSE